MKRIIGCGHNVVVFLLLLCFSVISSGGGLSYRGLFGDSIRGMGEVESPRQQQQHQGLSWIWRNIDALLDYRDSSRGSGQDLEERVFHREDFDHYYPTSHLAIATQTALLSPSSLSAKATTLSSTEYQALQLFYNSNNGPFWLWNTTRRYQVGTNPWNFTTSLPVQDPCQHAWEGLVCNCSLPQASACHIQHIVLTRYNITGTLPTSVFDQFPYLTSLYLSQNNLTGTIGSQFYVNLKKLAILDLTTNRFEGSIATSVNQLLSLQYLNLSQNQFMGTLPNSIYNLTRLEKLDLGYNGFQGRLSSNIRRWKALEYLYLANNSFTGTLPIEMFGLLRLNTIMLRNNQFHGMMPSNYLSLPWLKLLDIGNNQLTGSLPDFSNAKCVLLEVFHINTNLFTGTLTSTINIFHRLNSVYMYNNFFHGSFPTDFGTTWVGLQLFSIRTNLLTGTLPTSFNNWKTILLLSVQTNFIEDSPSVSYLNKPLLSVLELGTNLFTGRYPIIPSYDIDITAVPTTAPSVAPGIDAAVSTGVSVLTVYSVGYNYFTGELTEVMSTSKFIIFLNFRYNLLTGYVPPWIGEDFNLLNYLNLGGNAFIGSLPNAFGGTTAHLSELLLSDNALTGSIPSIFGTLEYLAQLDVSENQFTGTIPSSFFRLSRLKTLSLSANRFHGTLDIPVDIEPVAQGYSNNKKVGIGPQPVLSLNTTVLETIDISDNAFTGTLPMVLFSNPMLTTFLASGNCFHGSLSNRLCDARMLESLVLDGLSTAEACQQMFFPQLSFFTAFASKHPMTGTVPSCLFEMPRLASLHLSGNGLSGNLPHNVNVSSSLTELSLSHNQLTGSIPTSFQHRYWIELDLSFNKLHGILDSNMEVVNNSNWQSTATEQSATIYLNVNRLSGSIPSQLLYIDDVNVLEGNLFSCHIDRTDIPPNDPAAHMYICGSDEINIALYAWLVLIVCCTVLVLSSVRYLYRQHAQHSATGCGSNHGVGACAPVTKSSNSNSNLASMCSYAYWFQVYCFFHEYLDVYLDRSNRQSTSNKTARKQYSLLIFHQLLVSIRTVFLVITIMLVVLLIPSYIALTSYAGIYENSYAWQISAILKSGSAAGAVLTIEFAAVVSVVVYVFLKNIIGMYLTLTLEGNRMKEEQKMLSVLQTGEEHRAVSSAATAWNRFLSTDAIRSATSVASHAASNALHKVAESWERLYLSIVVGVFNFAIMILIDLVYVRAVLSKSTTRVFLIQILLSIFKLCWNEIVLWGLYPLFHTGWQRVWLLCKTFYSQNVGRNKERVTEMSEDSGVSTDASNTATNTAASNSNSSTATSSIPTAALDWTYSFSKQEIQFLAFTMILNNVIIPSISILIVSTDCYYNAFFATPPTEATSVSQCDYFVSLEDRSRCLSYSDTIATTTYDIPFTYRYQCSAAFVINFAIVHIFMFIIIGIVLPISKLCLRYFQHVAKAYTITSAESTGDTKATLATACLTIIQILLPKHMQDMDSLEAKPVCDRHKWKFVDKNKLIVKLSAYLSIVLSYGVVFPPIAIIACFSVFSNTYFEQLAIAHLLLKAKECGHVWYRAKVEKETQGIVEVWYGILWILAPVATFLYAWIIFDTIGDEYGWQVSVGPAVLIFIFPFLCMACKWALETFNVISMEQMMQSTAEHIIADRQSMVAAPGRSRAFTIGYFMESLDYTHNPMLLADTARAAGSQEVELADLKEIRRPSAPTVRPFSSTLSKIEQEEGELSNSNSCAIVTNSSLQSEEGSVSSLHENS